MNKKFSIEICSDLDFDGMVIDVAYNGETIASINYDKGVDNIEIEFCSGLESLIVPLNDFFTVLEKAKKLAMECSTEDKLI